MTEDATEDTTMRTVGEVATLAGVTVRTLHHYDDIGLVSPSGRSPAGYRLYDDDDLERLQTVLFYRELGFALDDIRAVMTAAEFDRGRALREQRDLLHAEAQRLDRLIAAVEDAITAHEQGATMSDEAKFEVFGESHRAWQQEAEQRWGDTDAWAQSRRRTAAFTRADWQAVKAESERIMQHIAEVYRSGAACDDVAAMDAVEAHRRQITERFYDCSPAQHADIAELYVQDPRFSATYEAIEPGLAVWVRDAVRANAARADG